MTLHELRNQAISDLFTAKHRCLDHAVNARQCIALQAFPEAGREIRCSDEWDSRVHEIMQEMHRLGIGNIGSHILGTFASDLGGIIADCERLKAEMGVENV